MANIAEGFITISSQDRAKQSIPTNTYKLLNKARANIEAVEQGLFGIGHKFKSINQKNGARNLEPKN